eukprot:2568761-Amphidinium_carterae.1
MGQLSVVSANQEGQSAPAGGSDREAMFAYIGNATADKLAKLGAARHGVTAWHHERWKLHERIEVAALA